MNSCCLAPLYVESHCSDCPSLLSALLEASARGPAACRAPAGSPQAAWHSGVGGERFHVSSCLLACPAPLYVNSCGSDQLHWLSALLEAPSRGPAACHPSAGLPQAYCGGWRKVLCELLQLCLTTTKSRLLPSPTCSQHSSRPSQEGLQPALHS